MNVEYSYLDLSVFLLDGYCRGAESGL